MKVVLYTAIIGNRDHLWSVAPGAMDGTPHVCFSDMPRRQLGLWTVAEPHSHPSILPGTYDISAPPAWDVRIVEPAWEPRRTARHYKCMPHLYFPDADVWIWVDGNVRMLIPSLVAIGHWLKHDLATFNHPDRVCVYDEVKACIKYKKDKPATLNAQAAVYRKAGMPEKWGLAGTRVVIRRNTPLTLRLNEMWWAEVENRSDRDQVSFPYVCRKLGLRWDKLAGWAGNPGDPNFLYIKHQGGIKPLAARYPAPIKGGDGGLEYQEFLYAKTLELNAQLVYEVGVRGGVSTKKILQALDITDGRLISCDIKDCRVSKSPRWTFVKCNATDFPAHLSGEAAMIYLDADHSYEAVRRDTILLWPFLKVGGELILDDTGTFPLGPGRVISELRAMGINATSVPIANGFGVIRKEEGDPEELYAYSGL